MSKLASWNSVSITVDSEPQWNGIADLIRREYLKYGHDPKDVVLALQINMTDHSFAVQIDHGGTTWRSNNVSGEAVELPPDDALMLLLQNKRDAPGPLAARVVEVELAEGALDDDDAGDDEDDGDEDNG